MRECKDEIVKFEIESPMRRAKRKIVFRTWQKNSTVEICANQKVPSNVRVINFRYPA